MQIVGIFTAVLKVSLEKSVLKKKNEIKNRIRKPGQMTGNQVKLPRIQRGKSVKSVCSRPHHISINYEFYGPHFSLLFQI